MHLEKLASMANDDDEITKCDQRVGSAVLHIYLQIKSNLNEEKIRTMKYTSTMAFIQRHFITFPRAAIFFWQFVTRTHTKAYFDFSLRFFSISMRSLFALIPPSFLFFFLSLLHVRLLFSPFLFFQRKLHTAMSPAHHHCQPFSISWNHISHGNDTISFYYYAFSGTFTSNNVYIVTHIA